MDDDLLLTVNISLEMGWGYKIYNIFVLLVQVFPFQAWWLLKPVEHRPLLDQCLSLAHLPLPLPTL